MENINYKILFDHASSLKKVLLVATGRTGSDFFQSLLDSHTEILQLPGSWHFHGFWKDARCKSNINDLINEFIWYRYAGNWRSYIFKFKSVYDSSERGDKLGVNKDESFEVSIDHFRKHMLCLLGNVPLNSANFFICVHIAYALSCGQNVMDAKIIFYHPHHIDRLASFKKDFSDFTLVCTTRDFRNSITSGLEHWKRYRSESFVAGHFFELIKRVLVESESAFGHTDKVVILKLENMHIKTDQVWDEFCAMFALKKESSLYSSTWHGKLWWGDDISPVFLNSFNKNIVKRKWKGFLLWPELFVLETLIQKRLKHYGYDILFKLPLFIKYLLVPFLIIFPCKYDFKIWFHNIFNLKQGIIRPSLESLFFYIKRVMFLYTTYLKVLRRKPIIPRVFAE